MVNHSKELATYSFAYPDEKLRFQDHFSSLLLSGEWSMTLLEVGSLASLLLASRYLPPEKVDVKGSMPLKELASLLCTKAVVARVYNTFCEAVFFGFPQHRIQPPREHALASKKDLCGRQLRELETIQFHDRLTLISQFILNVTLYYAVPGFFPAATPSDAVLPWYERAIRLVGNHYLLSFGMYWMHRALHVVPWLWDNIHSYHHWARHPLSRNTYQDHWLDNFMNAIVGHGFAQVLIPLDRGMFWFSHIFRIFESLEKHSGVSCYFNIVHSMQRCLPYAQMPHHHDWHHEGYKSCNYTFTSIGGVWDCIFGTRKAGRASDLRQEHITRQDVAMLAGSKPSRSKSWMDKPFVCLAPVVTLAIFAAVQLKRNGGIVKLV